MAAGAFGQKFNRPGTIALSLDTGEMFTLTGLGDLNQHAAAQRNASSASGRQPKVASAPKHAPQNF